jgi:hypothetical protein
LGNHANETNSFSLKFSLPPDAATTETIILAYFKEKIKFEMHYTENRSKLSNEYTAALTFYEGAVIKWI